jgi:flavorubredoxin
MQTLLRDNINWVGYVDWSIRDFHSYVTGRGATYNSYLIQDEKTALIDTVKAPYVEYLIKNIENFTKVESLDYVIVNHAEPDHASGLSAIMAIAKNATVVCTAKCKDVLSRYQNTEGWKWQIVKTGDNISLGKRSVQFIETPMVHWPESMFTYCPEEKILFSMDAFGQHIATSKRFDDEVNMCEVMDEAKTYFANIVMLYGRQISKTLEAASTIDIEMIAPAHGVIWRSHIGEIISAYKDWVVCKPKQKVIIIYDTMWESTKKMGEAILEGVKDEGVDGKLLFVRATGLTRIATEVLDAACIAFGSSTLNMGMMPMMSAALTYLKGLRPTGKAGFAFGSYGWGKGGAEAIEEVIEKMNMEILREPLKAKWRPAEEDYSECRAAGRLLGKKAKELAKGV